MAYTKEQREAKLKSKMIDTELIADSGEEEKEPTSNEIEVELIGSEAELTGQHTLHYDNSNYVIFMNGKAVVTEQTAEQIKEYIK